MTDCMNAEVRDALPDLMHGRLSELDTATMKAHVETCADCREELRLLGEIRASAPIAPRIDVSRIVTALPAPVPDAADQLIATPAPARRSSSMVWRTTAAAALLVTGSLTFATARRHGGSPAQAVSISSPVAEAPSASAAKSVVALVPVAPSAIEKTRSVGASGGGLSLTGGIQELSDDQLESLLNGLDDVEAIPSGEPESLTISLNEDGLQ